MIRSIALIHLALVLHSQMARLSHRGRRQRKTPDMRRLLDHPSYTLPVPRREKTTFHPRQPPGPLERTRTIQSGPGSRITFRLTHRRYQGPRHAEGRRTAPTLLVDPVGHVDSGDAVWKDREDWLQRLRPRPPRGPVPVKRGSCRGKNRL